MILTTLDGRFPSRTRFARYCDDVVDFLFDTTPKKEWTIVVKMRRHLLHENEPFDEVNDLFYQDGGLCWIEDDNYILIELARNFVDRNRELIHYSIPELTTTAAHELVHAKQWIEGYIGESDIIVEGHTQNWWMENHPHNELPWEREAYELQSHLSELW
jgi:hypothetical protein